MNQTIDFYTALQQMRSAIKPFSVSFVKLSLELNEGGEIRTLENQVPGPLRKNMNDKYMIGLRDVSTQKVIHIYIHTLLSFNNQKMILK